MGHMLELREVVYRWSGSGESWVMNQSISDGISLFNSRRYFEAHDALEAVWLQADGERRTFLHGLIQVAAAFHHYEHANLRGFRSLLEKGCAKLEKLGAEVEGVNLAGLMLELQPWRKQPEVPGDPRGPAPRLPHIELIADLPRD